MPEYFLLSVVDLLFKKEALFFGFSETLIIEPYCPMGSSQGLLFGVVESEG